jgi:hypothetical protein
LDSHLIYAASDAIKKKVRWIKATSDSEWIYFGDNDEVDKESALESICKYFKGDTLYVAFTRKESAQVAKSNIEQAINNLLGFQNFLIWDAEFQTVIEFNKIGTLRHGQLT